jgi:xylan 1,4-beta-xylosidase
VTTDRNYATGRTGSPIDYITFHAKGRPKVVDSHVQMSSEYQLQDLDRGFAIVKEFPELSKLPIILGESDPEGCAACSMRYNPRNAYRNGTMYSSYTAATFARKRELAEKHGVNLEGAVTWAFEFEDQPYFDGFRDLATNGIDKPVLNVFRMFGLMAGRRLKTEVSGALRLDEMVTAGVKGRADINALASRGDRAASVMVWNYHDDDLPAAEARIDLALSGIPAAVKRALIKHYRIDASHSNSYSAWKAMGSPQQPTPAQYNALEASGHLQMLGSPEWVTVDKGTVSTHFALPRQGVSLIQVSW